MPYIFPGNTDEEQYPAVMKVLRGQLFKEINESAAKASGVRALDLGWWYGTRNLTTKSKVVAKPDDLKGLKIRTMDNPMASAGLRALGASVTHFSIASMSPNSPSDSRIIPPPFLYSIQNGSFQ